ncbi:MAG: thioredoxin domain-containing protein, partial [Planctomycetota bacterium]
MRSVRSAATALVLLGVFTALACTTHVRAGADPPKAKERRRTLSADVALGHAAATRHGAGRRPNALVRERSPYLREHAFDPVDWRPWGKDAFAEAKKRDVPLFVSSGYSTCHWCHVMHRESFEDEECAAKLNASFVCVKVDREELPDVDDALIRIAEAFQGSAGWPCTVFFLPDGRPFYAGTYYPRNALFEMLGNIASFWADPEKRKGMADDAKSLTDHLAKHGADTGERAKLEREILHGGVRAFAKTFDKAEGGFRKAPKFPCAPELSFLLAHSHSDGARLMALFTLGKIVQGGIHDHLGGGFHRYATDEKWRVPHFEKTLYDQALLVDALVEAYALTREKVFADAVRSTCDYVLRDLRLSSGGFASAEDADSSGAEGLYYTWTRGEVEAALGSATAKYACARFGIEPAGSGPVEGRSVLHLAKPIADAAGPGADGAALESQSL